MKKFTFSLSALHTLRQRQAQQALEDYGRATHALKQAHTRLGALQATCEDLQAVLREQLVNGTSSQEIEQLSDYATFVDEQRQRAENAVDRARLAATQRWQTLLLARQLCETVEKLLQRERETYERELTREEQNALDDLAGRRQPVASLWRSEAELVRN